MEDGGDEGQGGRGTRAHARGERGGRARAGQAGGGGSEHGGRPRPPALAPHPRPSPRHATRLPTHRPRAADDAAPSPDSPVDPDHRGLGARSAARPQPGGEARSGGRRRGVPRAAAGARIPGARPRARLGLGASRPDRAKAGIAGGDGGVGADPGRAVAAREAGEPGRDNRGRRRGHGGKTDGVPDPGPSNPDRPRPARHGTANPPPRTTQATPRPRAARGISPRGTAAATALSASSPLSRSRGRRRPPPRHRPPFSHTSPRPTRATAGRTRRGEAGVGRPAAGTGHGAEEATVSALRGTEGPAAEPTPPHPGTGPRAGEARAPAEQALRGKPPAAPPRGARDPQGSD